MPEKFVVTFLDIAHGLLTSMRLTPKVDSKPCVGESFAVLPYAVMGYITRSPTMIETRAAGGNPPANATRQLAIPRLHHSSRGTACPTRPHEFTRGSVSFAAKPGLAEKLWFP